MQICGQDGIDFRKKVAEIRIDTHQAIDKKRQRHFFTDNSLGAQRRSLPVLTEF